MSGFGVRRPCETFRPWARWPQAFAPPYDRPERLEAPGPPLGSVVVLELSQLCSDDWARVPVWCPVVVVADLGVTRLFSLQLLTEARREVALVEPFARPGAILKAVRTRPAPPVGALLDWLRRRPVPAPMLRALDALIERAPERTVRHRFGRLGGWRSHDWSRILDLARAKGGNRQGQTALAEVLAIDRRTLSAWTHRYLGLRARQYDPYAGWEWVLEAALRRESGRLTGAGR